MLTERNSDIRKWWTFVGKCMEPNKLRKEFIIQRPKDQMSISNLLSSTIKSWNKFLLYIFIFTVHYNTGL
jgi:hypothetical protein